MQQASLDPAVTVAIPAYNSAQTVGSVIDGARQVLSGTGLSCEFIVVDDHSADDTWNVISSLARSSADVRAIRLRRNFGQHSALLAAIRAARGKLIVTMDDDLQHPPEQIPVLLAELERGSDVVYGFPADLAHSPFRNVMSWFTKLALQKAMGSDVARHTSAFRIFRTALRDGFAHYRGAYVSIDVLLTWGTQSFSWIEVPHRARTKGESNYTLRTLATHALTMMTGFSTLPLRFASILGLVFTAFGFLVLLWVIGRYFVLGGSVPGFPFLASTIAIFSGAQLFALGIIGEYLARVHVRSLGRPAYVIAEDTGAE